MTTQEHLFARAARALFEQFGDDLQSSEPLTRVHAAKALRTGFEAIEARVVDNANAAGLTWAEIGAAYDVSRQAAHRKFARDFDYETVLPSKEFDQLLAWLDEDDEQVIPRLAQAAEDSVDYLTK